MKNTRYPYYRLLRPTIYEYRNLIWTLEAGEICRYFAHSDTYLFDARDGVVPFYGGDKLEWMIDQGWMAPVGSYIFLGGAADFDQPDADCLSNWQEGELFIWTALKNSKPGDQVLFYITGFGIAASGEVTGEPFFNNNIDSHWSGRWMAEVGRICILPSPVPIAELRRIFADWRWLRYPRNNTQIPADIVLPLLELIGDAN